LKGLPEHVRDMHRKLAVWARSVSFAGRAARLSQRLALVRARPYAAPYPENQSPRYWQHHGIADDSEELGHRWPWVERNRCARLLGDPHDGLCAIPVARRTAGADKASASDRV